VPHLVGLAVADAQLLVREYPPLFVERLWKSVKYEHVYLHAYESVDEAKHQLTSSFSFYNTRRPHSSLGGMTPDAPYFGKLETKSAG
jgi:putative transposase